LQDSTRAGRFLSPETEMSVKYWHSFKLLEEQVRAAFLITQEGENAKDYPSC
jgi:hypothetical protein